MSSPQADPLEDDTVNVVQQAADDVDSQASAVYAGEATRSGNFKHVTVEDDPEAADDVKSRDDVVNGVHISKENIEEKGDDTDWEDDDTDIQEASRTNDANKYLGPTDEMIRQVAERGIISLENIERGFAQAKTKKDHTAAANHHEWALAVTGSFVTAATGIIKAHHEIYQGDARSDDEFWKQSEENAGLLDKAIAGFFGGAMEVSSLDEDEGAEYDRAVGEVWEDVGHSLTEATEQYRLRQLQLRETGVEQWEKSIGEKSKLVDAIVKLRERSMPLFTGELQKMDQPHEGFIQMAREDLAKSRKTLKHIQDMSFC